MQFTRKRNNQKKKIIFLSVLAFVICALAITAAILSPKLKSLSETEEETGNKVLIPIRPEEGRYNSYPIAYKAVNESSITLLSIENEKGAFFIMIPPDGSSVDFEFVYDVVAKKDSDGNVIKDENGNVQYDYVYYNPEILSNEDGMGYNELYAKVKGDGYDRIPLLSYLIAAVRAPYFDDRIFLSDDPAKKSEQLAVYGLSNDGVPFDEKSTVKTVRFTYKNDAGEEESHKIEIGSHTVTGSGYYFRVYDEVKDENGKSSFVPRDYIYVTRETNYFKYALMGVEAYINPTLVASGVTGGENSLAAPLITPDYRQWKTELHQAGSLPSDLVEMKNVTDVFAKVDAYMPEYVMYDAVIGLTVDSYSTTKLGSYIFNLTELSDNELYPYLLKALLNKAIGKTNFSQSLLYERTVLEGTKYHYVIHKVDAVITNEGDIKTSGYEVGDNQYIRVTYDVFKHGDGCTDFSHENGVCEGYKQVHNVTNVIKKEDGSTEMQEVVATGHGILDLAELRRIGVSEDILSKLTKVGGLEEQQGVSFVEFDVNYAKKNFDGTQTKLSYKNMAYYLDAVLEIYEPVRDEDGNITSLTRVSTLSDNSLVAFRYFYKTDGEAQNAAVGYMDMKAKDTDSEKLKKIRAAIKVWVLSESDDPIEVLKENVYTEVMSDFIEYKFSEIEGFVTGEIVSAFHYVNASERDPFYGESYYERSEDFMLYAINWDSCDKIVKLLGGLTDSSSANGLSGMETVAIGVTPTNIAKYGCEYIIRYSLPREVYVPYETDENELDDYSWLRTLDFVLYVSDIEWDPDTESNVRYVASKMYDIVVKIDADVFGFLELDQLNFWARHSLVLIDSKEIKQFDIKFNTEELKGSYRFLLFHSDESESDSAEVYDFITVRVLKQGESSFRTRFDEYLEYNEALPDDDVNKLTNPSLAGFYNYLAGSYVGVEKDTKGTAMFKEILLLLYHTDYLGTLTEEEQEEALKGDALFEMGIKLENKREEHCFQFYRVDDNRVMVRIAEKVNGKVTSAGYASDFYVESLAFEKIVYNFLGLLNGEELDSNDPYPDYRPIG